MPHYVGSESQKQRNSCLRIQLLAYFELLFILVHWQINFNLVHRQSLIYYSCLYIPWLLHLSISYMMRHFVHGIHQYSHLYFNLVFTEATDIHFREIWLAPVTRDMLMSKLYTNMAAMVIWRARDVRWKPRISWLWDGSQNDRKRAC